MYKIVLCCQLLTLFFLYNVLVKKIELVVFYKKRKFKYSTVGVVVLKSELDFYTLVICLIKDSNIVIAYYQGGTLNLIEEWY